MKKSFILLPFLALLLLTSCGDEPIYEGGTNYTTTVLTNTESAPTETTTIPENTESNTSSTTTTSNTPISNGGEYDDGKDWEPVTVTIAGGGK